MRFGEEGNRSSSSNNNGSGSTSNNARPTHRPQFHYFYGSVGTTTTTGGGGGDGFGSGYVSTASSAPPSSTDDLSDADRDSLVGESLVSTDNEGGGSLEGLLGPYDTEDHHHDDDLAGKDEYSRLLQSTGNGINNGMTNGITKNGIGSNGNKSKSSSSSICCRSTWAVVISLAVAASLTTLGIFLFMPHKSDSLTAGSPSSSSSSYTSSSSSSSSSSGSGNVLSPSSFPLQTLTIPFPKVDRSDYGDPVENFIDTSLFHPDLLNGNGKNKKNRKMASNNNNSSSNSTTASATFNFPFPTGAFWTNLVVPSPQSDGMSYPIAVYPYAYRWSQSSIQVSYPSTHRMTTQKSISDTFAPDLSIEILEKVADRYVIAFDPLSVTLRYVTNPKSVLETALVQGSPYITLQYTQQTPLLRPLSIFDTVSCPGDADENFSDIDSSSTTNDNNMGDQEATGTSTGSLSSSILSNAAVSAKRGSGDGGFDENRNKQRTRRRATASSTTPSSSNDDRNDDGDESSSSSSQRRKLFGVCSIDDSSDSQFTKMRGVQFIFHTFEGARWIMFSSEPMNLLFDKIRKTTVTSAAPFTGVIRLAYIPKDRSLGAMTTDDVNGNDSDNANAAKTFGSSTGLRRLIYHADAYPVGGDVSYEFQPTSSSSSTLSSVDQSSRKATVSFTFKTRSMIGSLTSPTSPTSKSNLLMLALPHHAELMISSVTKLSRKKFDLTYQCIKGNMTAIVGSRWSYDEPLYDLSFDGPSETVDDNVRELILEQVSDDLDRVLPTFSENVYGYGKQVARIAQLAHIAEKLEGKSSSSSTITTIGKTSSGNSTSTSNDVDSVLGKAKNALSKYLEAFLSSKVSDALLFDSKMGGLVSTNGLHDKGEDFGNGRYNDHIFHYGYFLYASAVMARLDPTFIDRFGSHVDTLFHDVAHTSNADSSTNVIGSGHTFFPFARHKSWFDGHSFATGMFPFGNGKSMESSSEAVNGYYGSYLWSLMRHSRDDSEVTDFAKLLLSTEIRGAKTYWHMIPPTSGEGGTSSGSNSNSNSNSTEDSLHIYPSYFEENYMVGNVGMLDVAVNTWFGADPLYVHMIQAIPITSISRLLFNKDYVAQEYPFLMKTRNSVEMAWRGYTTCIHAIIDPNKAWDEAQDLVSYELDSALSKSQVLYFVSQLPGFSAPKTKTTRTTATTPTKPSDSSTSKTSGTSSAASGGSSSSSSSGSSCEDNTKCSSSGLTGQCCPTTQGVFLECCGT